MGSDVHIKKHRFLLPTIISLFLISGIFVIFPYASADEIPAWVKGIANFWVEGNISDTEFGDAIVFLIEQDILKLDLLENLKLQVAQLEMEKAYILEFGSLEGFMTEPEEATEAIQGEKIIHIDILSGSHRQDLGLDYRECGGSICDTKYYSIDLLEIEPGTTVVWTNQDSVSHNITSGVQSFGFNKPNTPDGYMASGEIPPGESFSFTIDRLGFIRFFDTDYVWMDGTIISIPTNTGTFVGKN